jgi:hypothetical protein
LFCFVLFCFILGFIFVWMISLSSILKFICFCFDCILQKVLVYLSRIILSHTLELLKIEHT